MGVQTVIDQAAGIGGLVVTTAARRSTAATSSRSVRVRSVASLEACSSSHT